MEGARTVQGACRALPGRVDVAKLHDAYRNAAAVLLPATAGHGISIKTIEALSCGAPLIATPLAFRGLGINAAGLPNVTVTEDAAGFAAALRRAHATRHLPGGQPGVGGHAPTLSTALCVRRLSQIAVGDRGAASRDLNGGIHAELAYSHSTTKCLGKRVPRVSIWPPRRPAAHARPGDKRLQDRRQHGAVAVGAKSSEQPISPPNVVAPRPVRANGALRLRYRIDLR